jgi:hypothetical protein
LRGHIPSAGPDGWYLLILLPVFWTLAVACGRTVRAGHFLAAAGIFLVCEWRLTLGLLPGVYSGALSPNGANAPFSDYATLFASPLSALRAFDSVALISGTWLRAALGGWLACVLGALALAISSPDSFQREQAVSEAGAG